MYRRQLVQSRESALTTAIRMGVYTVHFNDPDLINTMAAKYNAVTPEQVKNAAAKYLVTTGRTVVTALPAGKPSQSGGQPGGQQ